MEVKELRIGNYVKDYYYDTTIEVSIKTLIVIEELTKPTSEFQCPIVPIPLTEEWLLMFGFKLHKMEFKNRYFIGEEFSIDYNIVHKSFYFNIGYEYGVNMKYIHQLQNLYYALTGQELQQ